MGWLIALGVLTLIAMIPVGVSAAYDENGPQVRVIIWPFRILVYPKTKKNEKQVKKSVKTPKKKAKPSGNKKPAKKRGGSIQDFLPIVDIILDFLDAFRRKLRVNNLELKLILAGSDPCDLAVNYGRGWAVLGNLMPLLENKFIIKKRDLEVECDFLADSTQVIARLDLTITIGRVVSLLLVQGVPFLRELLRLLKISKGGAKA